MQFFLVFFELNCGLILGERRDTMQITNDYLREVSHNELDLMDLYDELVHIRRLDLDHPACGHILNLLRETLSTQIKTPR